MMRFFLFALLWLLPIVVAAQPTGGAKPGGSTGDIQYKNGSTFGGRTPSGNGTIVVTTTGTQTSGDCVKIDANGNHIANGSSCGGAGTLTVTDGTHPVASTTTLTVGNGFLVGGSAGSATLDLAVPNVTKTANFTLTAAEMGGQVNYNGSSITATIPAISSTIFASGMSSSIVNKNATALTISTTPTINNCGAAASLGTYGWMNLVSNGTSLDAICFPGYGTITNGALVKFSGTGGITTAATAGTDYVSPTATGQAFTGGLHPTAYSNGTASGGTTTIDCGNGPIQSLTNGGSFTFAMSANDGQCTVRVTNNGSAGTITFSGFSQGSNSGDALDVTNAHIFDITLSRIGGNPHRLVSALQ